MSYLVPPKLIELIYILNVKVRIENPCRITFRGRLHRLGCLEAVGGVNVVRWDNIVTICFVSLDAVLLSGCHICLEVCE